MDYVVFGLEDFNINVKLVVVKCFYSLLCFVQQLRISFQDIVVWKFIMKLFQDVLDNMMIVVFFVFCNLLLEFFLSKEVNIKFILFLKLFGIVIIVVNFGEDGF